MSTLSKTYQDAIKKIDKRVAEACKAKGHKKIHVIYSAYDSDQWDTPIDNLDDVPLIGEYQFVDEGDFFDFRGKGEEVKYKPYKSEVMKDPTWLDIAVAANEMIEKTNDMHHIYFEDVVYIGDDIAKIIMGS